MSDDQQQRDAAPVPPGPRHDVIALAGARLPADRGLSALGLVMVLVGSTTAAIAAVAGFALLLVLVRGVGHGAGGYMLITLVCAAASIARSTAHRAAGIHLLYGPAPGAALRRYYLLSAAQVALFGVVLVLSDVDDPAVLFTVLLGFSAWPLLVALGLGRGGRALLDQPLPAAEDKGFEGAAVLMTILGLCGALTILLQLVGIAEHKMAGPGIVIIVMLGLLLLRSALHVHAGWRGLHEVHVDRAVEAATRYTDFAVIVSFVAGGLMLLFMMMSGAGVEGILMLVIGWLLLIWPMTLRRFFSERQFADLLAAEQAPVHRRAPDHGLTALGWLLLGAAGLGLAVMVPTALFDGDGRMMEKLAGALGGHSAWWSIGVASLQLWAGLELVRMGDHHRIASNVYGAVSAATSVYVLWPALGALDRFAGVQRLDVAVIGGLALQLVLPVATLLLVNRRIVPTARASFRARASK